MKRIVMLLMAVTVVGCTQRIEPADVAKAESMCANNEGLRSIDVGPFGYNVSCNNDARFEKIPKKEYKE